MADSADEGDTGWTLEQGLQTVFGTGVLLFMVSWIVPWIKIHVNTSIPWSQPGFLIFDGASGNIPVNFDLYQWYWGMTVGWNGESQFGTWTYWVAEEGIEAGWLIVSNVLASLGLLAAGVAAAGPERLRIGASHHRSRWFVAAGCLLVLSILIYTAHTFHWMTEEDLWDADVLQTAPWIAITGGTLVLISTAWRIDWRSVFTVTDHDGASPEREP